MQSGHSPVSQNFPMDPNRTFPFQKTNYEGDTEFWGNAQTHMDMVGHKMPFQ
jgi:hypothetical protein